MRDTSARLLRLLSLLQARRDWTGPALAERLGVTARTVRNDIERLRGLGYPVHATPGVSGGYRLGAGTSLPPLLLDDEEAVAVAVGLRTANTVTGIEETSVRALAKLEQVLPSRLRHRVQALSAATVAVPGTQPRIDADVLTTLAAVCRDRERLRFDYTGHGGAESRRTVEPHRLAHARGRWYLVAFDVDRAGWRLFRVDRMTPKVPTGPRFTPRQPPDDVADFVARGLGTATWRYRARVTVHAPAGELVPRLPPGVDVVEVTEHGCVVAAGSDTPHMLAVYIGLLDADFEVTEPPELVAEFAKLAERYGRAVSRRSPAG
ncbi:helix-turn-helix transcriptional regulator [Prauserella muralis]|uniref:DNA-binding transcriptional regulator n=1 Tax=Prauserella muralis TaxID=588067 RepID=A0A2V4B903_9PSEU|nr:YafY family protein [Prauserella muralis]PXY31720.1 DNA-binding transcriptional regulator [Prauserella muralis]TWE13897.1 putative DNA-binding transcriptional regulator YafY [Prauserella muralis]